MTIRMDEGAAELLDTLHRAGYAAYEAYITDPSIPHSIYEIRGARKVGA